MIVARTVLDAVLGHARRESPRECCGMLVGAGDRILDAVPARNLADSQTRYLIDPADHIRALREARARALHVVGFYHSHPGGQAFPSPSDVAEASYADAVWMIAAISNSASEIRMFEIANEEVREVRYEVER